MTVQTTTNKARFIGDASATTFPYTFLIPEAADLYLYFTDTDGTTTLIASTLYSVTGLGEETGGIVTYPLVGSPIAVDTILEILRTVPYTQEVDLVNQDGFYPQVVEDALDNLEMQMQQLVEVQGRNLTVGLTDTSPGELPSAAERANQLLGFDADGNAVASQPASATVSTAMQPVVAAATLAAGRTALGLGAAAVEGIGSGLQDDGAGNIRTKYTLVQDSSNQSVVVGFHATQRLATGSISYSLPKASTLFNGFGFWVSALTGSVSFLVNASDNFAGMASGQTLGILPGTQVYISTDAAGTGTWSASYKQLMGLNAPLDMYFTASVSANALTIALKDLNALDPSTTCPVLIGFRDPTASASTVLTRVVTSSLSITVPSGATLGTANGVPFRLWFVAFDNAGTVVLGVIVAVVGGATPTSIVGLDEAAISSGVAISAGSGTAGIFYSASTITSKAFRILGYMDFPAGQVTAGAWATAPTKLQPMGLGVKKPGEVLQTLFMTTAAPATADSTTVYKASTVQKSVTLSATCNLVDVEAAGTATVQSTDLILQLLRDAVAFGPILVNSTVATGAFAALRGIDAPGGVGPYVYSVGLKVVGTLNVSGLPATAALGGSGTMIVRELMA